MRPRASAALLATAALVAVVPGRGAGQRLGVYFDDRGARCTAAIQPFGPSLRVHIIAYPESEQAIAGAVFSLQLPASIRIHGHDPEGLVFPGEYQPQVTGRLSTGLDLQYFPCLPGDAPVTLVEFDIFDASYGGMRYDLRLRLAGAAVDSIQYNLLPALKICNPFDPESNLGFIEAQPDDALLNCTQTCVCTSAIAGRTWGAVKALFQER